MDNDFTVTAAYITAIAAIVAPAITALIHSIKEYKIYKMSHTIDERLKLLKLFSASYSRCQYGEERIGFSLAFYKDALNLAALCEHKHTRRALIKLAKTVLQKGASKATDVLYERCIRLLSEEF